MNFDDDMSALIPAPIRPARSSNPLSVLAVTRPDYAVDLYREELHIKRQALRVFERVETVKVYRDLGLGQCATANTWLQNRREGEKHIRVATHGGLNLTTTVEIR